MRPIDIRRLLLVLWIQSEGQMQLAASLIYGPFWLHACLLCEGRYRRQVRSHRSCSRFTTGLMWQVGPSQKRTHTSVFLDDVVASRTEESSSHRLDRRSLPGKTFQIFSKKCCFQIQLPAMGTIDLIFHTFFCPEANAGGWQSIC